MVHLFKMARKRSTARRRPCNATHRRQITESMASHVTQRKPRAVGQVIAGNICG
jgi:hypothetical protein